jgi:hypothetical protein
MRGAGADGLEVAMKPGNAGGAKGPDIPAPGHGQPARGGAVARGKAYAVSEPRAGFYALARPDRAPGEEPLRAPAARYRARGWGVGAG